MRFLCSPHHPVLRAGGPMAVHSARACLPPPSPPASRKRGPRDARRGRPAALPDALGDLPAAAAAAAAASALTAAWLYKAGRAGDQHAASQPAADQQVEQQPAAPSEEPPASREAVWAAAWQGFDRQPAEAAASAGSSAQGAPPGGDPPSDSVQDEADEVDGERNAQPGGAASALQRTPLLLLQGIRAGERSRLLSLCLAALEAQLAALPPGAAMLQGSAGWHQLAAALLALASLAAASAWLGYVPAQLLAAAAAKLAAVEPAVLRAAGLEGSAAALAAAAAAAGAAGSGSDEEKEEEEGTAKVDWYCLDEKLQLYSSVLRLLACAFIEQPESDGLAAAAAAAGPGLAGQGQQPAAAAAAAQARLLPAGVAAAEEQAGPQEAPLASSELLTGQPLARQQALALLRQQQQGGAPGAIRGWRATAAGTRSNSQLLALAPSVLQDMAVTAADAVAAAYLADAAAAGPTMPGELAAAAVAAAAGAGGGASSLLPSLALTEGAVPAAAGAPGAERGSQQAGLQPQQQQAQRLAEGATALAATALLTDGPSSSSSERASSRSSAGAASRDPAGSSGAAGGSDSNTSDSDSSSSTPLEAGWWPTFVHSQLGSTRQLQRFTNAVALNRWVQRQYRGVADVYEDRLRLFGIARGGTRLEPRSAPMRRTRELGKLTGLRYAASLLLEAADLLLPLLRTLWSHATSAVSWLLVRTVGQAVALVRRGVQQGTAAAAAAAASAAAQPAGQRQRQEGQGQQEGQPGEQQQAAEGQRQRRRRRQRRQQGGGGDGGWRWGGDWDWAWRS